MAILREGGRRSEYRRTRGEYRTGGEKKTERVSQQTKGRRLVWTRRKGRMPKAANRSGQSSQKRKMGSRTAGLTGPSKHTRRAQWEASRGDPTRPEKPICESEGRTKKHDKDWSMEGHKGGRGKDENPQNDRSGKDEVGEKRRAANRNAARRRKAVHQGREAKIQGRQRHKG